MLFLKISQVASNGGSSCCIQSNFTMCVGTAKSYSILISSSICTVLPFIKSFYCITIVLICKRIIYVIWVVDDWIDSNGNCLLFSLIIMHIDHPIKPNLAIENRQIHSRFLPQYSWASLAQVLYIVLCHCFVELKFWLFLQQY